MAFAGMGKCAVCGALSARSGSKVGPHRAGVTQPRLSYLIPRPERCVGSDQLPCG